MLLKIDSLPENIAIYLSIFDEYRMQMTFNFIYKYKNKCIVWGIWTQRFVITDY